jgi:molecular chaperone DnaJ
MCIRDSHNNDLVCQVPISFTQACLGADLEVPTLKGPERLHIPAGTQHGEVFKLKGKGLPDMRSYKNGDEVVQILIEIPKKLSEKQKQLLKEFSSMEDDKALPQRKGFVEKLKGLINGG